MGVIFDILGSFIIRTAIAVMVIFLMSTLNDALYRKTEQAYLNDVLEAPAKTITADLKLAGYGNGTSKTFSKAKVDEIEFSADLDNNGTAKTVHYTYSQTYKTLYREVTGIAQLEIANNVESFTVEYYNASGNKLNYGNNITNIKSIYVTIKIKSTKSITTFYSASSDGAYLMATWKSQIFPENL